VLSALWVWMLIGVSVRLDDIADADNPVFSWWLVLFLPLAGMGFFFGLATLIFLFSHYYRKYDRCIHKPDFLEEGGTYWEGREENELLVADLYPEYEYKKEKNQEEEREEEQEQETEKEKEKTEERRREEFFVIPNVKSRRPSILFHLFQDSESPYARCTFTRNLWLRYQSYYPLGRQILIGVIMVLCLLCFPFFLTLHLEWPDAAPVVTLWLALSPLLAACVIIIVDSIGALIAGCIQNKQGIEWYWKWMGLPGLQFRTPKAIITIFCALSLLIFIVILGTRLTEETLGMSSLLTRLPWSGIFLPLEVGMLSFIVAFGCSMGYFGVSYAAASLMIVLLVLELIGIGLKLDSTFDSLPFLFVLMPAYLIPGVITACCIPAGKCCR